MTRPISLKANLPISPKTALNDRLACVMVVMVDRISLTYEKVGYTNACNIITSRYIRIAHYMMLHDSALYKFMIDIDIICCQAASVCLSH